MAVESEKEVVFDYYFTWVTGPRHMTRRTEMETQEGVTYYGNVVISKPIRVRY